MILDPAVRRNYKNQCMPFGCKEIITFLKVKLMPQDPCGKNHLGG